MPNYELFIFIGIEFFAILTFFICFRISRKNGGVFDRRIFERRSRIRRTTDWLLENEPYPERSFSNLNVTLSAGDNFSAVNEIFDIDIDRRIYGRRSAERRKIL